MAQETSGTISKTILKNEMLPLLVNEQRRADRAYALGEQAKRRAAELAAKKAAEDAKYVPEFQAGLGSDMWEHIDKAKNEADIQQGLALVKDNSIPRQQVATSVGEINRKVSQRSNISKQLKENTLKTAEDLQNRYRKVGPDYAYNWAKQQQDYRSPEEFAREALADPNLIDFDAIGKKGENYKLQQYTFRDKNGNTKNITISPLFEYQKQYDPTLGVDIPVVTGVNGIEATNLIKSDADMQDAFKVWAGNRAKEYQTNRTFYDPATGSPMMIRPDLAEDQAAKEFVEQSFGKYGSIKYGQQAKLPGRAGGGGGSSDQFTMSITAPAGMGTHQFNVQGLKIKRNPLTLKYDEVTSEPQVQTGPAGSKDDQVYAYDREYPHPANKRVRLLRQYDNTLDNYFTKTADGGYLLKTGFNYSNPTKRTLYFADEDIYIGGDENGPYVVNGKRKNWSKIEKGNEVPPALAEQRKAEAKKKGQKSGIIDETGYEVTANMYTGEDGDTDAKRPSVPMFIPEESAGEIKKHIEMEQQKKRKKRGPETTVDNFQGGEVDLGY
jgi:hypothetical protein